MKVFTDSDNVAFLNGAFLQEGWMPVVGNSMILATRQVKQLDEQTCIGRQGGDGERAGTPHPAFRRRQWRSEQLSAGKAPIAGTEVNVPCDILTKFLKYGARTAISEKRKNFHWDVDGLPATGRFGTVLTGFSLRACQQLELEAGLAMADNTL